MHNLSSTAQIGVVLEFVSFWLVIPEIIGERRLEALVARTGLQSSGAVGCRVHLPVRLTMSAEESILQATN